MTVRRIDPETGDIVTRGQHFTTGIDEIAQTIVTRLKLFSGEYSRDIAEGTPWFQTILGKGSSNSAREAALKNRILRTEGVTKLLNFSSEFNIDDRSYSVHADVMTIYGPVTIAEAFTNG